MSPVEVPVPVVGLAKEVSRCTCILSPANLEPFPEDRLPPPMDEYGRRNSGPRLSAHEIGLYLLILIS